MSSRTPAPEEFGFPAMPDLPGDLFDQEESLYDPVDYRVETSGQSESFAWDDDYAADEFSEIVDDMDAFVEKRPGRSRRHNLSDNVDIRPRRRQRPPMHVEPEVAVPERRRPRYVSQDHRDELQPRPRRPREQQRTDVDLVASQRLTPESAEIPATRPPARAPRPRQRATAPEKRAPSRQDSIVEQPRMRTEAATADIVTSIMPGSMKMPARPRVRKQRNPAWQWEPIVLPQPRQMVEQAFPSLLMAASVLGTLGIMRFLPGGLPLWAPMILIPSILLLVRAGRDVHPWWARSAFVNLVVVGSFFPMMIVRQSFLRVPFVEFGNGTLVMPVLATAMVVVAMVVIALGSAFLSQEDPEYAGMLFLPAALLVPFFAGATEITGLETALAIVGGIYVVTGLLTVVASMLPAAFPTLVAPIALALEFFILPVSEQSPIFPVGAGMSAKLLFFVVLAMGVGLTVAVPMMSVWVRQVLRIVRGARSGASVAAA